MIKDDVILAQESSADLFKEYFNAVGTGAGYKISDGRPTNDQAVIVFVERKISKRKMMSKFAAPMPTDIDGIPVDVIEVGKLRKHDINNNSNPLRDKVRPLKPGYSCGHIKVTCGTLGGFFTDKDGDKVILSNCHVLANEGNAAVNDLIYQPGCLDARGDRSFKGWTNPRDLPYIAQLKAFSDIVPGAINYHDSAIAKLPREVIEQDLIDLKYPILNRPIKGFAEATVNMSVHKCGRTTGYTTGRVIAVNAEFGIQYDKGNIKFGKCIVSTPLSQGGDSGSLILDYDMNVVGLLFGGSPKVTVANPIGLVRDQYGLSIIQEKPDVIVPINNIDWAFFKTQNSSYNVDGQTITFNAKANEYACIEAPLPSNVRSISCEIFTGSDTGASWGPGLVIMWNSRQAKINLRYKGQYGSWFDGTEYMHTGEVKPNTWYNLRAIINDSTIVMDIDEIDTTYGWTKVLEISRFIIPSAPNGVRIGKTDISGNKTSHSDLGQDGSFMIRNVVVGA